MAPMRLEARALERGLVAGRVLRAGVGPRRARRAAVAAAALPAGAVAIAGLAGALAPGLEPGEVVLADRVLWRSGECAARCADPEPLAAALRDRGLRVHIGAVVSVRSPAVGATRQSLSRTGALAVDMESVWLAPGAAGRPLAVVRVVLDSPRRELANPWQTLSGLRRAGASLRVVAGALSEWGQDVVQLPEVRD
jgi:4-hydroxy-3-methylbut-2-enyl diphosphate reductase